MGRPPKQTKISEGSGQLAEQQTVSRNEVAVFNPPRLPYHDAVEERFGVDKGQWKVLTDAIFPAAKSIDAIVLALTYCKSRNLDIFKRPVHIVPLWDSQKGGYIESVWPGISELRTTASRTKGYAGCDEAQFGERITMTFKGRVKEKGDWKDAAVEVEFPEWCRITVYRVVDGQRCKFVGPKVAWLETYATQGASELPNKMWQERPEGQLEKCAEAAALRRAFPEEIGNELTAEEMIGRNVHDLSVDIPAATGEAAATPNRDAGPPRQITPPTDHPQDTEQARDGTPPPRQPKAEPKQDPITTGPINNGPPRTTAPKETGPADPPVKPYRIPGDGHTFESWAEKYSDLIKTSPDIATVYGWIDANSKKFQLKPDAPMQDGPLTRLQAKKPSVYGPVKITTERVMEKLRAEQEKAAEKAKKKTDPPPSEMDEASEMDDGGPVGDQIEQSLGAAEHDPGPADTNPETILKWAKARLATVTDPDALEAFYNDQIEPHIDGLFPPDREEIMAEYKRTEKRLGID